MTSRPHEGINEGQMLDVGRYARAARSRWLLILFLGSLGAALGSTLLPSSSYEASAVVQVNDGLVDLSVTGVANTAPNMSTELEVANSASVVAQTLAETPGGLSVSQFQSRASVSSPPNSTTITFTFSGDTAAQAQTGAAEWAASYLEFRERELNRALSDATVQVEGGVENLEQQLDTAQAKLAAETPNTPAYGEARRRVQLLVGGLSDARAKLDALGSVVVDPGTVIGDPLLPTKPSGLSAAGGAVIGLLAGLVFGLIVALVLERLQSRVRHTHDVARATAAPVWGTVTGDSPALIERAYDAVAARLVLAARHQGFRTVLVTAVHGDAHGPTEHLAAALTRLGARTWVSREIQALLDDRAATGVDTVSHLQQPRFLLVDGPALLSDPRTAVMSSEADVTLVTVQRRRTRVSQIRDADEVLEMSGGHISGVLIVPRDKVTTGPDVTEQRSGPASSDAEQHHLTQPSDEPLPANAGPIWRPR